MLFIIIPFRNANLCLSTSRLFIVKVALVARNLAHRAFCDEGRNKISFFKDSRYPHLEEIY